MLNVAHIIQAGGLALIAAIIFAESGMFVGFFFPGDTLLLSAGVFIATGKLSFVTVLPVIAIAAIIGDNVGYHIGKRYGRRLFRKPDGLLFRQEYIGQAESFYEKHGNKAVMMAHFVPVVRTFAPAVAGVARMDYKKYVIYDAIGDIAWTILLTVIGYEFGSRIPNLDHYILLSVLVVMVVTLGPTLYHVGKALYENYISRQSRSKHRK
jgi:membrane-associated protein